MYKRRLLMVDDRHLPHLVHHRRDLMTHAARGNGDPPTLAVQHKRHGDQRL
jgi:hypothetical protein